MRRSSAPWDEAASGPANHEVSAALVGGCVDEQGSREHVELVGRDIERWHAAGHVPKHCRCRLEEPEPDEAAVRAGWQDFMVRQGGSKHLALEGARSSAQCARHCGCCGW